MPFPDAAWCAQAIAHFNADPDAPAAARGWSEAFGLVIDAPAGPVGVYIGAPVEGRLPAPEVVTPEQLSARAPAYFARASDADWRRLIAGSLDPIAAIVQKRLVAKGDLAPVIARLQYRGLAERWLALIRPGV